MIKMEKGYHNFVFDIDNRKFVGEFDKMYKAETTKGFDSWDQDDVTYLDCPPLSASQSQNVLMYWCCLPGEINARF